jgi:hypothetical protein
VNITLEPPRSEIEHRHLEENNPDEQDVNAVRRQCEVEPVGRQEVNLGPARQCHQQTEQAANCEKDDGRDRIGLDQFLGSEIDLEACRGAGAKFCIF